MEKLLQVQLNDKQHKALTKTAHAVHLETKSAIVRCFAAAVEHKSAGEIRRFLFTDSTDAIDTHDVAASL